MRALLIGLFGFLAAAAPARAVDYGKIDRTVLREPAYQSGKPGYALFLFGPEARLRVWVVLDGDAVYIDRNGDGDLTAKGKRFAKPADCKDIEIADPDGRTRYVITSLSVFKDANPPLQHLIANVDIKGPLSYQQYNDVALRPSPREANISHFHGPLTAGPRTINWKIPPQFALTTGEKPADVFAVIGTMDAKHGCWVVVRTHHGENSAFGKGVFPVVDVEFPPKTPGAPAVKERYRLEKFC